ncbi:MAG: DUF4465 domain-containing protein [Thermoguttaceae bacterium]|nr:DUF4465 domain-containing protein [Thermoguttaceae bacterium]MDW8037869.1 DUF4465 domain-containing protein [Thermoguttaceae bacterium]
MRGLVNLSILGVCFGLVVSFCTGWPRTARAELIDFEDLALPPNSHFEGTDTIPYDYTATLNPWTSRGMTFPLYWAVDTYYGWDYTWWYGVTYSNHTWSGTPPAGLGGQYTAYPPGGTGGPGGAGGSANYAVFFCTADWDGQNYGQTYSFTLDLPQGKQILGLSVANNCYVWNTLKNGDPYGFSRKFGYLDANGDGDYNDPGDYAGNYPDYFLLRIIGLDGSGQPIAASPVDVYLADYRFENSQQDYILESWLNVNLSGLAGAEKLLFRLSSTDVGQYGMNTPAYFLVDNILLAEIPEPASGLLMLVGVVGLWVLRRRWFLFGRA